MTGNGHNNDIGIKNGKLKAEALSDSEDDVPLSVKIKSVKKESSEKKAKIRKRSSDSDSSEPSRKKSKLDKKSKKNEKSKKTPAKEVKKTPMKEVKKEPQTSPKKVKKESEEPVKVWKWWEEEKLEGGAKWRFLEHLGPCFPPAYERLPSHVKFFYDGEEMTLSDEAEEVAGFYAKMLDHEYTSKETFNKNFFRDWQKVMTEKERSKIKSLSKCNFKQMFQYFKEQTELRKQMSKEDKKKLKEENAALVEKYGYCSMDGHKQRIANFRLEPPGLFRGRGDHPKMGMLKKRLVPEQIIINCSKDSKIPVPPAGHKWKEIRHDNTVTWLACWVENVQGNFKYIMLNASSRLKGEKDWKKYETARRLHAIVDKIRAGYRADFKSKEMRIRQRAVALYFIDKLALRAGNEKDEDEADTVGCCSLRYEHIKLHDEKDGKQYVVEFDFLGKDSIRYNNSVPVLKRVYKNLNIFLKNKQEGDDLFDRLNTSILNTYLRELMEGLTAKVFRTYNASKTLEEQLDLLTDSNSNVHEKVLSYNRANRAVAILCNHQRAVPKTFQKSMEGLQQKITDKKDEIKNVKKEAKHVKSEYKNTKTQKSRTQYEKLKKRLKTLSDQLEKLQLQATDKDENKDIALGTSKLNYLDPRISIAWCRKNGVPIEKIYSKTQREKFQWAIDMTTKDFRFSDINSDTSTNKLKESHSDDEEVDDEDD